MVSPNNKNYWLDCTLLVCLAIIVYYRVIGCGFQSHWDDNGYILNNPAAHGFSWEHLKSAFNITESRNAVGQYNPIPMITFMLDAVLWDMYPAGFHFTNLLIHVVNGILVYRLLMRLHGERIVSLVGAIIFLIHPVQVESVAWISERKGLLSLCFMIASWNSFSTYQESDKKNDKFSYVTSLLFFVFSLLAKTASVVLPVILIVYSRLVGRAGRRITILNIAPFLLVTVFFSAIEVYSGKTNGIGGIVGYHGGSPVATFYTMLTVFCLYLRLLVWPSGLNVEHLPPVHTTIDLMVVGAALFLFCIGYASFRLYKFNRLLGFWVAFFWIGLLPVSQIIPTVLMMYEHYLYMPIIAVSALVGSGVLCLKNRFGAGFTKVMYLLLVMWFVALSVVSFQRIAVWRDSITLFSDATSKSPEGARVWEVLGEAHFFFGNKQASKDALEKSLAVNPNSTDVLWALAEVNTEMGALDKGQFYLNKLFKKNPNFARGWATQGNVYRYKGNYTKAREMYIKALSIQPDAVQVEMMLARLELLEHSPDEARVHLRKVEADKRGWNTPESAYLLACTESLAGRTEDALSWLETALKRGYSDYYTINTAKDLSAIWDNPKFNYLMLQYFPGQEYVR